MSCLNLSFNLTESARCKADTNQETNNELSNNHFMGYLPKGYCLYRRLDHLLTDARQKFLFSEVLSHKVRGGHISVNSIRSCLGLRIEGYWTISLPHQRVTDEIKYSIIKYFLLELKVDPYKMYWVSLNKSTVLEISIIQMASSLFEFFLECGISVDRLAYSSLPDNQKFDVRGGPYQLQTKTEIRASIRQKQKLIEYQRRN